PAAPVRTTGRPRRPRRSPCIPNPGTSAWEHAWPYGKRIRLRLRFLGDRRKSEPKGNSFPWRVSGVRSGFTYPAFREAAMLTTLSLSPCIDRRMEFDGFRAGATNRVVASRAEGAGKAVNVALAARALGMP